MFAMTFRAYRSKRIRYQLMTIVVPFIYACTDEFHQGFADGRSPKFFDVCIDTCGACTAIVIMIGINILIKKIMTERDRNEDLGTVY